MEKHFYGWVVWSTFLPPFYVALQAIFYDSQLVQIKIDFFASFFPARFTVFSPRRLTPPLRRTLEKIRQHEKAFQESLTKVHTMWWKSLSLCLNNVENFTARCTLKKVSSWGWKRIHWHLRGAYILNWGGVYPFACLNLNGIAPERRKPGAKNATLAVRSIMRPLFYSETGLISRLTIIMQMKVLALYWQFLFILFFRYQTHEIEYRWKARRMPLAVVRFIGHV